MKESGHSNAITTVEEEFVGSCVAEAFQLCVKCGDVGCRGCKGLCGGRFWCDVDVRSELGDFGYLGILEQSVLFVDSYESRYFDRAPVDWEFMWRGMWDHLVDNDRYLNVRQELCPDTHSFVHCCMCDKPFWDDKAPFSEYVSPSQAYGFFKALLEEFPDHTMCRLDVISRRWLSKLTPGDFYLAFVVRSNDYPLALRWAAYKAYALALPRNSCMFDYMYDLVNRMEKDVRDYYYISCRAEGFVEDSCTFSYDLIITMVDFCFDMGESTASLFAGVLTSLMKRVVTNPSDLFCNFKDWLADAVIDSFTAKVKEFGSVLVDSFKSFITHPLTSLLFKTMVRWWMGLTVKSLALEILWDRDLRGFIPQIITTLNESMKSVRDTATLANQWGGSMIHDGAKKFATDYASKLAKPLSDRLDFQDPSDPTVNSFMFEAEAIDNAGMLVLIASLALGAFGTLGQAFSCANFGHISRLSRDIYTSASLLDKLGAKEAINKLICYVKDVQIDDEENSRLRCSYPRTMSFVDYHVEYSALHDPNNSDRSRLKHYYAEFLKERVRWPVKEAARLNQLCSPAVHCAMQLGATAHFEYRREPSTFLFMGPPGLGKTSVSEAAANAIANKENPDVNLADAIYTVCFADGFSSGYNNQQIWKFDDMLKKVDTPGTPSPDIDLMFSLSNTAPFVLNMAALEDKGKVARCYLNFGSTNLNFFDGDFPTGDSLKILKRHIQSICNVDALRRRFNFCVLPLVQKPYHYDDVGKRILDANNRPIKDTAVDRSVLYRFHIMDVTDGLVVRPSFDLNTDPNGNLRYRWTWSELLNFMWKEYCLTRDYEPSNDLGLVRDSSLIVDEIPNAVAEGWQDLLATGVCALSGAVLAGVVTSEWKSDVICPCGKKSFLPNPDCCLYEERYRARNRIEPMEGEWKVIENFSTDGVKYAGSFVPDRLTCIPRFALQKIPDAVAGGEWKILTTPVPISTWAMLTDLVTGCLGRKDVVYFEQLECVTAKDCILVPGIYRLQVWSTTARRLVHKGSLSTGGWLAYSSTSHILLPLIGAVIGGGLARMLSWKREAVEADDHVVMKDGEPLFLDPDTMQYQAQAPLATRARMFKNGKWYYKVRKNNGGYEWYAQAPESNPFVSLISKSQRLENQAFSLKESIWAIVDEHGVLQGNVFAIDAKRVLCPLHVARMLESRVGLKLVRGAEVRKVSPNFGIEQNVTITEIGPDAAIVEFFVSKLPEVFIRCREHITKFVDAAPKSGQCTLMRRNAAGDIEFCTGNFMSTTSIGLSYPHGDVNYDLPASGVRLVDVASDPGWCGALYVDISPNAEKTCLGIHVARGKVPNDLAMMHVVTNRMLKVPTITVPVGNVWLTGYGESYNLFHDNDIPTVGKTVHPTRGVHGKESRKVKTVFHEKFDCGFDLAKLAVCEKPDGTVFDPWKVSLRKLGDRVVEPDCGAPGVVEVVHALVDDYKPHFHKQPLPGWAETVSFDTGLPSVSKSTSAGHPYEKWGGLKGLAFLDDFETNVLKPEYLEFLEWFDDILVPRDWKTRLSHDFLPVESICSADNKDEPRLVPKNLKPRLYTIVPMQEFLAQRRYFADLAVAWGQMNVVFSSALGIAPVDFDVLHLTLAEAGDDCLVLALDHEHMDGHVKPRFVRLVCLFMVLLTESYEASGRVVDPLFPPLNRRGFMMWRLLQRLAWFVLKVGDSLAEPGAMHPSGSFLTAMINGVVQDILMCWVFQQLLDVPIQVAIKDIKRIFLGDDSLVAIPRKYADKIDVVRIKQLFALQGFVVTGADKDPTIKLHELWDCNSSSVSTYGFLSRNFATVSSPEGLSVVGLLEPAKIEKIICFVDKKKCQENFPEQIVAMLAEIEMYDRCCYFEAMKFVRRMKDELDTIAPNFMYDSFHVMRSGGDIAVIKLKVLNYMNFNKIMCTAQAGEGSQMSGLTDFVSDVVSDSVAARDEGLEDWRSAGMENAVHNEKDVFSYPYACHDFDWDVSSPVVLFQTKAPQMFFDGNANAQMKLANYAFMRGVAVMKVIINGSPYVAGKLLLSVRPLGRASVSEYEASGDPCVEIDAASGKEAEIRMPCIIPHGWSLVEQYGVAVSGGRDFFNWGQFTISVLSALADVSSGTVYGRVYCWLEDVQLQGPTPTAFTISAQAPPAKPKSVIKAPSMFMKNGRANPFSVKMAGSRVTESSALSAGIDKYVAPVVRSIGGVITDVGAGVLAAAQIAALVGLSVPQMDNNTTIVTSSTSNFSGPHVEGIFPGVHLASRQQQKVVLPEGVFDMSDDEMQIAHFASRMGLCCKIEWTAADLSDTILQTWPVNPGCHHVAGGLHYHSPVSFMSTFFRFWRGTMRYRLAIAKTRFHNGTIEVCLSMGSGSVAVTSEQRAARCYRKVWNVSEMSSIEIDVPYSAATPWSQTTQFLDTGGFVDFIPSPYLTSGVLTLRVVNPLISAGGTVVDSVEILLYCAGGKDIEFAVPSFLQNTVTLTPSPILGEAQVGGGVFQDDETDGVECLESTPMFPANPMSNVGQVACVGETIHNLRLLTRRFPLFVTNKTVTAGFARILWQDVFVNNIFLQYFQLAFAFASGGFRVEITRSAHNGGTTYAFASTGGFALGGSATVMNDLQVNPSTCLSCPYYGNVPYLPVAQFIAGSTSTQSLQYGPLMSLAIGTSSLETVITFRGAAADDFTFGWQIGLPGIAQVAQADAITAQFVQYSATV